MKPLAGRGSPGRAVDRNRHVPGHAAGRLRCAAIVGLLLAAGPAVQAQSFRCEVDGRVSYGDRPCPAGKQTTVASAPPADPEARADALARHRRDQAAVATLDRERRQDEKAAALSKRRDTDVARHAQACTKLSRRVRDTRDAYDTSGPRDQAKNRLKMQRAAEDFAAMCKR